jgi:hypothetical protein
MYYIGGGRDWRSTLGSLFHCPAANRMPKFVGTYKKIHPISLGVCNTLSAVVMSLIVKGTSWTIQLF